MKWAHFICSNIFSCAAVRWSLNIVRWSTQNLIITLFPVRGTRGAALVNCQLYWIWKVGNFKRPFLSKSNLQRTFWLQKFLWHCSGFPKWDVNVNIISSGVNGSFLTMKHTFKAKSIWSISLEYKAHKILTSLVSVLFLCLPCKSAWLACHWRDICKPFSCRSQFCHLESCEITLHLRHVDFLLLGTLGCLCHLDSSGHSSAPHQGDLRVGRQFWCLRRWWTCDESKGSRKHSRLQVCCKVVVVSSGTLWTLISALRISSSGEFWVGTAPNSWSKRKEIQVCFVQHWTKFASFSWMQLDIRKRWTQNSQWLDGSHLPELLDIADVQGGWWCRWADEGESCFWHNNDVTYHFFCHRDQPVSLWSLEHGVHTHLAPFWTRDKKLHVRLLTNLDHCKTFSGAWTQYWQECVFLSVVQTIRLLGLSWTWQKRWGCSEQWRQAPVPD